MVAIQTGKDQALFLSADEGQSRSPRHSNPKFDPVCILVQAPSRKETAVGQLQAQVLVVASHRKQMQETDLRLVLHGKRQGPQLGEEGQVQPRTDRKDSKLTPMLGAGQPTERLAE